MPQLIWQFAKNKITNKGVRGIELLLTHFFLANKLPIVWLITLLVAHRQGVKVGFQKRQHQQGRETHREVGFR